MTTHSVISMSAAQGPSQQGPSMQGPEQMRESVKVPVFPFERVSNEVKLL